MLVIHGDQLALLVSSVRPLPHQQQTIMDGQKNWGKCRFSQRISCLAFSSFRWGKPMRGIPLGLEDRKAGLGPYGVDLVRLIWFFFPRATFLNEQLNKWICATLLISLREGSCFGVGCVHLHVGVNVKNHSYLHWNHLQREQVYPYKKYNALMQSFSEWRHLSFSRRIHFVVCAVSTIFKHSRHNHVAKCRLTWAACDPVRSNFVKSVSYYNRAWDKWWIKTRENFFNSNHKNNTCYLNSWCNRISHPA